MNPVPDYLQNYSQQWTADPHAANLAWFCEARFGLFIHYGLYSLLGVGEWAQFNRQIPIDEYAKLADRFTAERFDVDQITDLACEARMKYVNLVTCHHDSFSMWDSKIEAFNSRRSAARRDFVAEMAEQCHKKKLGLFTYYTYALNWRHPYYMDNGALQFARPHYAQRPAEYRYQRPEDFAKYVDYVHAAMTELLTQFGPIAGVWMDIISAGYVIPELLPMSQTYELIRKLQPHALVAYKQGATGEEDFASCEFSAGSLEEVMRERHGQDAACRAARAWEINRSKHNEVCSTLGTSWGWSTGDVQKTPDQVMALLGNTLARRCNLLLNVGPLPDGSIPEDAIKTLREVGRRIDRDGWPTGLQTPADRPIADDNAPKAV